MDCLFPGRDSFGYLLDCSICFEQSAGCLYVTECSSTSRKATAVCGNVGKQCVLLHY